ncbi:MAG: ATP-binding protein [Phycisphaerae bacterium]|nr:ATP-binding protein [Phycisphaerae bacterium]
MKPASSSRLSLRTRVLLLTGLALGGMIAVVYLFSTAIILTSFGRLERQMALRDTQRAKLVVEQRIEDVATKLNDWSTWDDAYDFVESLNPRFEKSNLNADALALMKLTAVVFVHAERGVVRSLEIDRNGEPIPASKSLLAACGLKQPLTTLDAPDSHRAGLMLDGERLLVVAARPIVRSDGGGPIRGALIFAAAVDDQFVKRATSISQAPLEVWPIAGANLPRDVQAVRQRFTTRAAPLVLHPNESTIAGYFPLDDAGGKPVAIARVRGERSIIAYGRACVNYFLVVLMVVGLLVAVVLRAMLGPLVLDRVFRLRDSIRRISETRDLHQTLQAEGDDEIGDLAHAMNAMVRDLAAAQDELDDARTRAETASEAKGRFLANMSHEIRTPLNGVLGFSKLLIEERNAPEAERLDWARTIHSSSEHLLALINDILDFSKIDAGRMTLERMRCSLREMIGDVVRVQQVKAAEKGLQLSARFEGAMPASVQTDPTRLRQVVDNLVSNAIKFTRSGSVQVVARASSREGEPRIRIEVRDSGCGIPVEKLHSIFDPFTQADNSVTRQYGGTGLGLAISRQIALALGGELAVTSDVGHGSTFTIEFHPGDLRDVPLDDGPPDIGLPHTRPARPTSARAPTLNARVLLVEDGETNRKLITLVLQRAGASVTAAENGRRGVELAMQQKFDAILMDMQMPVMDGYAATATLRRRNFDTPIIALTAHALQGDEERCRACGCSHFLSKPVDPALLIQTIADAVGIATVTARSAELAAAPATASNASQFVPLSATRPSGAVADPQSAATASGPTPARSASAAAAAPSTTAQAPIHSTLPTDDPEFREIVVEFVDRLAEQIGRMQEAYENQEMKQLAQLAHWLKGAGGTAGFRELTAPAEELEQVALAGAPAQVRTSLATVASIASRIEVPQPA